jgi:hypothetical protein
MLNKNTQAKILNILKNFFFLLGVFSVGTSIYLFFRDSEYIILLLMYKAEAIWLGLWAPTCFIVSNIFDNLSKKR